MQKKIVGSIALTALLLLGAGCNQPATNSSQQTAAPGSIKIGWVGPLTGDFSEPGTDAEKAAQLAVDEINAAGGVNGQQLDLVAEDGKADAKTAADAANYLINIEKVPVILSVTSGETLAMAPLAENGHAVLLSSCASAPKVTDAGDYTFRTFPSDVYQGKFGADYVYNTLGKRKVATLAIQTDYGSGIQSTFESNFKALGGEIVDSEQFSQDSRDLKTQLTKIKSSGADAIYFVAYTDTGLVGLKEMKELGINLPIISSDSFDDATVYGSGLAEGVTYSVPGFATPDAWKAKMQARGANISACAPRSYDNVELIASIMKQVGTSGQAIKNALYQVNNYQGIAGPISFDSNGDVTQSHYDVMVVHNDKPVKQ